MLVVGTADGRVRLVDPATGVVRWEVQSDPGPYLRNEAVISPDGRFVASVVGSEEHWTLWDSASGSAWMTGARHDGTGACSCPVTAAGVRTSLDGGCPVHAHTAGLLAVAFPPCGAKFATGGQDRAVILWDVRTGNAERRMQGDVGVTPIPVWEVSALAFSADGARMASGSDHGVIRIYDSATGALLRKIAGHLDALDNDHRLSFVGVQFSPTDSRRLLFCGSDWLFGRQWDVESGQPLEYVGYDVAEFSPDGSTIITANCNDPDLLLIDAASGETLRAMVGHTSEARSASFSLDGSKLASGDSDNTGECSLTRRALDPKAVN